MTEPRISPPSEWHEHPIKFLDDLADYIHQINVDHGFWDGEATPDTYVAKMMLITSEIAEIMEAYRKKHEQAHIVEEFADAFIRLVDLYSAFKAAGIVNDSFRDAILRKVAVNAKRPHMHNNLI